MSVDIKAVARVFVDASSSGDDALMDTIMDPEIRIWHNHDGVDQTRAQNLKVSSWLRRKIPDLTMTDVRQDFLADGWVQRHMLSGTRPDGSTAEILSCIVFTVSDAGLITRMEEYLDPSQLGAL
jgi:uncharacterized protein